MSDRTLKTDKAATTLVVAVCAESNANHDIASALAQHLALQFLKDCTQYNDTVFLLVVADQPAGDYQLQLQFPGTNLSPVFVDFRSDQLKYRQQFGGGRQQPLARALGLKKGNNPVVVDATAGLGRDAFIMAVLGCQVLMVERHAVIHALLEDGLRRLANCNNPDSTPAGQLYLHHADSLLWLKNHEQPVDIVYLDPMYPHRTKSALVKKEMRILRSLVGDDMDVPELLETSLSLARNRVVVKRPKTAPPIGNVTPSHCIESRKTRYDVYLTGLTTTKAPKHDI